MAFYIHVIISVENNDESFFSNFLETNHFYYYCERNLILKQDLMLPQRYCKFFHKTNHSFRTKI